MMLFGRFNLNFIIFCAIFCHSSYGAVKRSRSDTSKLKDGKDLNKFSRSINTPKTVSIGRDSYSKSSLFQNRDTYDYSLGFDSFLNNMKNYPQSTVSYYPFSLDNSDYLYPKVYNRFYPYTSNIIPRSLHPTLDFPAQDDPIPFYRDAQYDEPTSEVHIIKHLVPIAYPAQLISPREAVVPVNELFQPNYLTHENADILLRELGNAAEHQSNSTDSSTATSLQEKVKVIAQLMIRLPAVANDVFKCLSESDHLNAIIKATSGQSSGDETRT